MGVKGRKEEGLVGWQGGRKLLEVMGEVMQTDRVLLPRDKTECHGAADSAS